VSARGIAFGAALCALLAGSALAVRAQSDETLRLPGGPAKAQIRRELSGLSLGRIDRAAAADPASVDRRAREDGAVGRADGSRAERLVATYLAKYFNPQTPAAPDKLVRVPK